MALEDVAHRLVADRQAQVGQRADNPVIAPGAILLGYTHDQGLQLWINPGASRRLTLRRAVKFLTFHRITWWSVSDAHRKPPDVRICRLSLQSGVGTRPPSTSTPHWPACW